MIGWQDEQGFPGLPARPICLGVKRRAPEAGCSEAEAGSVTGQSLEMVRHYGKRINRGRLR